MSQLILSGGTIEKDLAFKNSQVTHLRLILAWMRCEYMLDENMQGGFADAAKWLVENGYSTEEEGRQQLARQAEKIRRVPQYVRHGIKMLTKMVHEHDKQGDTVDAHVIGNRLEHLPPKLT